MNSEHGPRVASRVSFTIPLEDSEKTFYLVHPKGWPRVDVAALPITRVMEYPLQYKDPLNGQVMTPSQLGLENSEALISSIKCIQDFEIPTSSHEYKTTQQVADELDVSDELFILGYPRGITDRWGQPLWKRATIASSPSIGWNGELQFLVDCASRQGMSGAPAIFHSKNGILSTREIFQMGEGPVTIFIGIYVGRLGNVSDFEAQIGTIWSRSVIDEIFDNKTLGAHSNHILANAADIKSAMESAWPADAEQGTRILEDEFTHRHFQDSVMKRLQGRANPLEVSEAISKFARDKLGSAVRQ